jgi:hypothetical protein
MEAKLSVLAFALIPSLRHLGFGDEKDGVAYYL